MTHARLYDAVGALILCAAVFIATLPDAVAQQAGSAPSQRSIITPTEHPTTVTRLPGDVNSTDDDFAPFLHGNNRVLYFTSNRDGDQNIYSIVRDTRGWTSSAEIAALNSGENEGSVSVTPDGHVMIFTACERGDGSGDCDLYMAEYAGGTWRNVRNLGPLVNSPNWDSQPTISADGLTLIFASDRPGGIGGTDLWMSTRRLDGDWGAPINLGRMINTPGDEIAPSLAADNRTLYFSSDTHPGIGGFDVYRATRMGMGWEAPVHMGVPLNSAQDDYFCALELAGDDVYFASNRPGGAGGLDLYIAKPNPLPPAPVTTVIGQVTDSRTGAPLGASLTVRDIRTNEAVARFRSDDVSGDYVVVLQTGRSYVITAESPEYLFYSDRFDVPAESRNTTVRKDIEMTRDAVRLLVFFDFDKATLQPESHVDLDRAVAWLTANPGLSVELAGHTDNKGTPEYNRKLSQDRAVAVKDYLVSKGVAASRLSARGYGLSEPVTSNDTEDGRARNRRVEFRIKR